MSNILNSYSSLLKKIKFILIKPEKKSLFMLSIGSVVLSLAEIFSIGIIFPIMLLLANPEQVQTSRYLSMAYKLTMAQNLRQFFLILISIAIMLFIFKSAYSCYIFSKQQSVIGGIYTRLATRLMRDYLAKPYSFHLVHNSSLLLKNIVEEMGRFTTGFLNPAMIIISETLVFSGVFLLSLYMYPAETLVIILVFGIVLAFLNYLLIGRVKRYSTIREQQSGLLYVAAIEALGAVKEIQMYDVNKYFTDRFSKATTGYIQAFVKFTTVSNFPRPILEAFVTTLLLLWMMVSVLLNKSFADLIPKMTVVGMVCLRLLSSISKIYNNIHNLYYHANSVDIVHDIIEKSESANEEWAPRGAGVQAGCEGPRTIHLKDVTYRYETASAPIFKGLSVEIPMGKVVAIVGKTGAGKSTLIDILMGLLAPTDGHFYYDGSLIGPDNIAGYRRKIGYVPQNFFLADDSIRANIAFGIPQADIDPDRLEHAIRVAQLGSFIKDLPSGVDTLIGEKGTRISGGQRQRIGLARALYRDPEILVLDESTSALDKHTEEDFYGALKKEEKKMSVILVTHRLSTLEHADLIFVMEGGKVAAKGSFRELSESSPVFQGMTNQKFITETKE
ncbi:MAG: ABC transporter ATP-binding protein [Candidatus Omnitrophota bacterium]